MNLLVVTCGLPGPAYHGGAVTCWAIVKTMLSRGHRVTILSLFDNSELNPYIESKDIQKKALNNIGAEVEFADHNYTQLIKHFNSSGNAILRIKKKINSFLNPRTENLFPWAKLKQQVHEKLEKIKPDAIFAYHFDALSTVYNTTVAPIMAGVGDLWYLPAYFSWKAKKPSIRKYIIDYPYYLTFQSISKKLMLEMLKSCKKKGAFAAHYAEWLKNQNGLESAIYLRTPIYDSVGPKWKDLRKKNKSLNKPKILMIGDLSTTSTSSGLRYFLSKTLPILEEELGKTGFEVHMVGSSNIPKEISERLNRKCFVIRGRIIPPDPEFLSSDLLLVPTPINLGIRVRIIVAFSFGCPVVAHEANRAGIPELAHNHNSLLSDSGQGMAMEIIRLIKNPMLKERLEENGRITFERYFSEKIAAASIVKEMEEMANLSS